MIYQNELFSRKYIILNELHVYYLPDDKSYFHFIDWDQTELQEYYSANSKWGVSQK